jgi:hypothetical protein
VQAQNCIKANSGQIETITGKKRQMKANLAANEKENIKENIGK